jgi:hypothetical protein
MVCVANKLSIRIIYTITTAVTANMPANPANSERFVLIDDNGVVVDDRTKANRDIERLARWMDSVFEIPLIGFRFGLDAILGLFPVAGDVATSLVSIYILQAAQQSGVPRVTLTRMTLNIIVDLVLGSIPFVGDLFDAYWKSNQRNVDLLRRHLEATPAAERKLRRSDRLFVAGLAGLVLALTAGSIVLAYFVLRWLFAAIQSLAG